MPFEMIDTERTILVFNLDGNTHELINSESVYIAPGTGLPADSTDLQPPAEIAGNARVFDVATETWQQIEDHRGQMVYHKETAEALKVMTLGALTDAYTLLKPDSDFDKWDGSKWVKDADAEKQYEINSAAAYKKSALESANVQIQIFSDAVSYGMATKGEALLLKLWGIYRVQINRIDVNDAPGIVWPGTPAQSTDDAVEAQAEQAEKDEADKAAAEKAAAEKAEADKANSSEEAAQESDAEVTADNETAKESM